MTVKRLLLSDLKAYSSNMSKAQKNVTVESYRFVRTVLRYRLFCCRGGKKTRRKLINLRVLAIPSYKNEAMVACKVRVLADDVSKIKVVVENE